jgi:hypothetical protein
MGLLLSPTWVGLTPEKIDVRNKSRIIFLHFYLIPLKTEGFFIIRGHGFSPSPLPYIIHSFPDRSEQMQYQGGFIPIFIGIPRSPESFRDENER